MLDASAGNSIFFFLRSFILYISQTKFMGSLSGKNCLPESELPVHHCQRNHERWSRHFCERVGLPPETSRLIAAWETAAAAAVVASVPAVGSDDKNGISQWNRHEDAAKLDRLVLQHLREEFAAGVSVPIVGARHLRHPVRQVRLRISGFRRCSNFQRGELNPLLRRNSQRNPRPHHLPNHQTADRLEGNNGRVPWTHSWIRC